MLTFGGRTSWFFIAILILAAWLAATAILGAVPETKEAYVASRETVVHQARLASVKVYMPGGGHGSGVVIADDGRILTNQHICGRHKELVVENMFGVKTKAQVLWHGEIREYDLCLIRAGGVSIEDASPVSWDPVQISTQRLWVGLEVFHIGNMMDVRELVSFGSLGRLDAQGWNKQAAYAYVGTAGPGSSGGGVFDMDGNLVGLIYSGHQVSSPFGIRIPLGVGHILPAHMIELLLGR